MTSLPETVQSVLGAFAPLFSDRVWQHAQVLLVGAILAPRSRTVAACLRVMGLSQEQDWCNFHRVLNRVQWSALQGSRILLGLLVATFLAAGAALVVGIDDTLERRSGQKIKAQGCFRDPVRSSKKHTVKAFGLRWVSMMLLVSVPFSSRPWALPFLTVLAPSAATNQQHGRRHKTAVDWAGQMLHWLHRWARGRPIVLVVDGGYAAHTLAWLCLGLRPKVTMVSRLRLDAQLYHPPGPQPKSKRGPKPKKGKRQRSLTQWAKRSDTPWQPRTLKWYGGVERQLKILSRTSLWYTPGSHPLPIRWVLVQDPTGKLEDQAFLCTDLDATPDQILAWVIQRWSMETTFQEGRAHLGLETQRQWSDLAIARTTPVLLALFSIVTLIAHRLFQQQGARVRQAAWYQKPEPTFSDLIAAVRKQIWGARNCAHSTQNADMIYFPKAFVEPLLDLLAYAA